MIEIKRRTVPASWGKSAEKQKKNKKAERCKEIIPSSEKKKTANFSILDEREKSRPIQGVRHREAKKISQDGGGVMKKSRKKRHHKGGGEIVIDPAKRKM